MGELRYISDKTKREIFLRGGLDDPNKLDSANEFRFCAHAVFGAHKRAIAIDRDHFCSSGKSVVLENRREISPFTLGSLSEGNSDSFTPRAFRL
jgi:hypothetical protein